MYTNSMKPTYIGLLVITHSFVILFNDVVTVSEITDLIYDS